MDSMKTNHLFIKTNLKAKLGLVWWAPCDKQLNPAFIVANMPVISYRWIALKRCAIRNSELAIRKLNDFDVVPSTCSGVYLQFNLSHVLCVEGNPSAFNGSECVEQRAGICDDIIKKRFLSFGTIDGREWCAAPFGLVSQLPGDFTATNCDDWWFIYGF